MTYQLNLSIDSLTNFKSEIKFPNEFINIEGACILSKRRKSNIYNIKEEILAKANALYILDNIWYDPYEIWEYSSYSIILNCKFPVKFKSFYDYCKYLVLDYKNKMRNIINQVIDPNCDVKNVSDLISDFYFGVDKMLTVYLIHYYYDDIYKKNVITISRETEFIFNNIVNPFVIYPQKDTKIYLGIFIGSELISLSDEIFLDRRYFHYKHINDHYDSDYFNDYDQYYEYSD